MRGGVWWCPRAVVRETSRVVARPVERGERLWGVNRCDARAVRVAAVIVQCAALLCALMCAMRGAPRKCD